MPLNCCSALHEFAVVVPNARLTVFELLTNGYVKVSAACLELKVVQSAAVRKPFVLPEAAWPLV